MKTKLTDQQAEDVFVKIRKARLQGKLPKTEALIKKTIEARTK